MDNGGVMPGSFSPDSDTLLILALVYILYSQNADRTLLLALLSILIA